MNAAVCALNGHQEDQTNAQRCGAFNILTALIAQLCVGSEYVTRIERLVIFFTQYELTMICKLHSSL